MMHTSIFYICFRFDDFKVKCCLYYGDKQLVPEVVTHSRPTLSQGCQKTLVWDEWFVLLYHACYVEAYISPHLTSQQTEDITIVI